MSYKYEDFYVTNQESGLKIISLVKKILKSFPVSLIYKAFRKGYIRLNSQKSSPDSLLSVGYKVSVHSSIFKLKTNINSEISLDCSLKINPVILYEDKNFVVIDKPLGMLVTPDHRGKVDETLVGWINGYLKSSSNFLAFKPAPLHQLDRNTTGVLVCSASPLGARVFSEFIQKREITKEYLGFFEGDMPKTFYWKDLLLRNKRTFVTRVSDSSGKEAVTYGECIAYVRGFSLARLFIKTGVTHQIRVQASLHGFPLLNDSKYGSLKKKGLYYLHCISLKFSDILGLPSIIKAPLPLRFIQKLEEFGISYKDIKLEA